MGAQVDPVWGACGQRSGVDSERKKGYVGVGML